MLDTLSTTHLDVLPQAPYHLCFLANSTQPSRLRIPRPTTLYLERSLVGFPPKHLRWQANSPRSPLSVFQSSAPQMAPYPHATDMTIRTTRHGQRHPSRSSIQRVIIQVLDVQARPTSARVLGASVRLLPRTLSPT